MKKNFFRIISVFLALITLSQTLPLAALAVELREETSSTAAEPSELTYEPTPETETDTELQSNDDSTEPVVLLELEELREPNKKTFRMSDGTFREAIYPYDVHYEDENGVLLDIDNSLVKDVDGGEGVLVNQSNASTVRFFKKSSGEKFYTLENDKNKVTVSIAGAEKVEAVYENNPKSSGNRMALTDLSGRVNYSEIFPGVDLEYTLVSKRIKENVIIKEKDALSSLTYTYAFNGGVTVEQKSKTEITVYNKKSENELFTITAPALWDSDGNYSEDLTLSIVEAKNSKLTVRLDFTIGEEMIYPVTVDPILQFQAERNDIHDTHIIASYPTDNYNVNNHIRVRNNGYALLQFPTPTLRPGDKIVNAQVALFPYGYFDTSNSIYSNANSYNPTLKVTAHRIKNGWDETTVTYQSANPDNGFYEPTAESYHVVGSNSDFYTWDITRLAMQWTEKNYENYGILLKYAAPPSDGSMFDTFFCSTNGEYLPEASWPQIIYSYINTTGVEEYFSYHTQSLGFAGEGYVNDMTGNLTVTRELVTTGGNVAPISLSLIYNTNSAVSSDSAPYGTGWKLNLAQKCVYMTPPGSSESYVQYTDADGTQHYFKNDSATGLWVDEIDPDRKIYWNSSNDDYEMKDSSGTTLLFTKHNENEWYLYKVVDLYGNYLELSLAANNPNRVNQVTSSNGTNVWLDYSPYGFLTSVRYMDEGVQKTISVSYNNRMSVHNNGITDIVFPDSSAAYYNYWEGTSLISTAVNLDNSFIQYNYSFSPGRVISVREVTSAGVVGNRYDFSYEPTATTVTDVQLGRTYLYTFSANGTLKSVVDTTANDGNGYGQYYEYNGGNTSLTGMGNLTFASKTQKNTVNLLPNHSFETNDYIAGVTYGTDSGSYDFSTEKARLGNRSYKLTAPASGMYDVIYGFYYWTVPAAEEYTLSAYINTAAMTSTGGGAKVVVIVGSNRYDSEVITEAKDEWQRLSVTFPLEQTQSISLCVSLSGATGSIYFDNMQLETGGLSDYNLLENAGFETDSTWEFYGNTFYTAADKSSGARSGSIISTPDTDYHFVQTVSVPGGKAGDTYVASAFAKATSVPTFGWNFTLLVRFLNNGATVNEQNILFNSHTTNWQKVSGAAAATGDYNVVQFWLLYYQNCNTVYFDNAQLIQDTFGTAYTYDANGNLISTVDLQGKEENTFTYDGNNQLIRQSNISGGQVLYSYNSDKKTQLEQVTAGGNTTVYTYDGYGNATSSATHGATLVPGEYYYLQNVYYSDYIDVANFGTAPGTEIGMVPYGKNDAQRWKLIDNTDGSYSFQPKCAEQANLYLTVSTVADVGNVVLQPAGSSEYQKFTLDKIYGNIYLLKLKANSEFALDGDGTNCYIYTKNGGPCQQFALIHAGDGSAAAPVLSSSAAYSQDGKYMTSMTDSRGNSVSYTYNTDRGYVKSETDPKGNTTSYFYTPGEQLSSVTSGGSTVSYGYNSAKQLTSITTPGANGGSVYGISYDAFGRKSGVTVGGNTLATYTYNQIGLTETVTYGNNTVTRYVYDDLGRLTQTFINNVPQSKTVYDGSSRVHEQYDLVGNRKVKFEYDILGREVKRSLYDTANNSLLSVVNTRYDDAKNRVVGYEVTAGGKTTGYTYGYGENKTAPDSVTSVQFKIGDEDAKRIEYEYDALNRLSTRTVGTATPIETNYTYLPGADSTKTTTLVSEMQTGNDTLSYSYDANGNISSVSKNNQVYESYSYDSKNQLTAVTRGNDTWAYTYDLNGNITSATKNGSTKAYSYENTAWKDLLTKYNGQSITYDEIGNPLQYRDGMTMTWANGRKLNTVTKNNLVTTFTYDGNGNRIRKHRGSTTIDYTVIDGVIYAERRQALVTNELHFLFDENGARIGFVHNGSDTYYYRFNLQGDVTGIFSSSGTLVTEYTYDAWGKPEQTLGNSFIGLLNPIRYRGYYYDTETGLYYLQSRYYDPETGRFINPDAYLSTGQGILGYNMFAYCGNNPVNYYDPTGTLAALLFPLAKVIVEALVVITLAVAIVATAEYLVDNPPALPSISIPKEDTKEGTASIPKVDTKEDTTSIPKTSRKDPVHHIVPQKDHRAKPAQEALEAAGIDRFNDPANLVQLPAHYHYSIHSNDYYEYVNEAIVTAYQAGGKEGIYSALAVLKWEITSGALW